MPPYSPTRLMNRHDQGSIEADGQNIHDAIDALARCRFRRRGPGRRTWTMLEHQRAVQKERARTHRHGEQDLGETTKQHGRQAVAVSKSTHPPPRAGRALLPKALSLLHENFPPVNTGTCIFTIAVVERVRSLRWLSMTGL